MTGGWSAPGALLARAGIFFVLWGILIGPEHRLVGLAVAAAATAASLRLLPPARHRPRVERVPAFVLRFAWQSVVGGWDVARRAFDPHLTIRPGFVRYPVGFPPGPARNVFTVVTGLVPGTVPADEDGESVTYHCLDVSQPVAAQLAAEEAALARLFGS